MNSFVAQGTNLIPSNKPAWLAGSNRIASSLMEEPFVLDRYRNLPKVPLIRIRVEGMITTLAFQRARLTTLKLHQLLPSHFSPPQIKEMLQFDWHEYVQKLRRIIGGRIWVEKREVVVFINDMYIGTDVDLQQYVKQKYDFNLPMQCVYYQNLITEHYKQFIEKTGRIHVYFTFTINNQIIGSFLFMLYSDLLPNTCQNFLSLCVGDKGVTEDGTRLHYKDSRIHRIVKNGWLQCGDIQLFSGGAGCAANGSTIPDESYTISHNRCGVLSMANNGKHSNGSQFIVSLKPNPWMDYHYVAFGYLCYVKSYHVRNSDYRQLVDGVETLRMIEQIPTYYEMPMKRIIISQCGKYSFGEKPEMEAGPNVFLERVTQPVGEEENPEPYDCNCPEFSGLSSGLSNIVDELLEQDSNSLIMAERCLNSLYCLATSYLPGPKINLLKPNMLCENKGKFDMSCVCEICESIQAVKFESLKEGDQISLICGVSEGIVACAMEICDDEVCLERISMDRTGTAQWVLEIAHDVAVTAVARTKKDKIERKQFVRQAEPQNVQEHKTLRIGLAVVEKILNAALMHVVEAGKIRDTKPQPMNLEEL